MAEAAPVRQPRGGHSHPRGEGSLPSVTTEGARTRAAAAPSYRCFEAAVARVQPLCPTFRRITLSGPELHGFGHGGADQRVKLVLPSDPTRPDDSLGALVRWGDDWYSRWRALPDAARPVMRTYTVRAVRPELAEVDVDVVLHGAGHGSAAGPASSWAAGARPGDRLVLVGPDRPGSGRAWGCEWAPPAGARTLLLAGDETAVPAVCSVLEQLSPGTPTLALLEVPHEADVLPVATPAGAEVRWLPRQRRGERHPHGRLLTEAVRSAVSGLAAPRARAAGDLEDVDVDGSVLWDVPAAPEAGADGLYAWLAGEAGMVKELRRHLVRDIGVPRSSVAFMGYWRAGRAEAV